MYDAESQQICEKGWAQGANFKLRAEIPWWNPPLKCLFPLQIPKTRPKRHLILSKENNWIAIRLWAGLKQKILCHIKNTRYFNYLKFKKCFTIYTRKLGTWKTNAPELCLQNYWANNILIWSGLRPLLIWISKQTQGLFSNESKFSAKHDPKVYLVWEGIWILE
jgi:hypothetical protein